MSEQKTAKVTEVVKVREWRRTPQDAPIYYYTLTLDNGETGEIGKKKENFYQGGETLVYTSEENQYGLKFKEVQQNGFGGGFKGGARSSGSPASFALAYAKDIAVANINKSDKPLEMESLGDKVISTATKFYTFMKERE